MSSQYSKMTIVYVTAVYCIYNDNTYVDQVWARLQALAAYFPLYVFCSKTDATRVEALTNVTPIFHEFAELNTYACIQDAKQASVKRNLTKDTKEYMILMNAKTEFIQRAKAHIHNQESAPSHYVWFDAGISKIFKDPAACFSQLKTMFSNPLRNNTIFIPGRWPKHTYYDIPTRDFIINPHVDRTFYLQRLTESVNWRFCGGFIIVPAGLVDIFATTVMQEIIRVRETYGMTVWEVNTWTAIEDTIPIQWEKGNHDETIFSRLPSYYLRGTVQNQPKT